jgi:hypothetical protein
VLAPAAAGSVLELCGIVHLSFVFCFSFLGTFLLLPLFLLLMTARYASIFCLLAVSALIPMAQMKPSSSRPAAVMIFRWSLPRAASLG